MPPAEKEKSAGGIEGRNGVRLRSQPHAQGQEQGLAPAQGHVDLGAGLGRERPQGVGGRAHLDRLLPRLRRPDVSVCVTVSSSGAPTVSK